MLLHGKVSRNAGFFLAKNCTLSGETLQRSVTEMLTAARSKLAKNEQQILFLIFREI